MFPFCMAIYRRARSGGRGQEMSVNLAATQTGSAVQAFAEMNRWHESEEVLSGRSVRANEKDGDSE